VQNICFTLLYFILFSVFWLDVTSNVLLPNIILFKIEKIEKNTLNHSKYYFICFSYFWAVAVLDTPSFSIRESTFY